MVSEADQKVLNWIDELCQDATTAVHGGDMALVNRIGTNPALNAYFVNVVKLQRVSKVDYAGSTHMVEARRVYNSYQQDELQEQRMTKLETALAQVLEKVTALAEAAKPADPPTKGKPKAAKQDTMDTEEESAE